MSTGNVQTHITASPQDTRRLAAGLAAGLPARAVLALHGELGSGKTCFVQGLARALGIRRPVTSPTFTIISEYQGTRALYHIDLYRLNTPDEVLALGVEEYFETDGIVAIEWAERAGDVLPPGTVHILFETLPGPERRKITVETPVKETAP